MIDRDRRDNQVLIDFWSRAYDLSDQDRKRAEDSGEDGWRELAPSEKLLLAAAELGSCRKVLDYGCGTAWAAIAAAKSGCRDVTAVDLSDGPLEAAGFYASVFKADVNLAKIGPDWLRSVPDKTFDGLICSNVLDIVPEATAQDIINQLARISKIGAAVKIGLNFHMSEDSARVRGMDLADGRRLYVDSVLRLVSLTDDEWTALFSRHFRVQRLEHFSWPGEKSETRRLFHLVR